MNLLLFLFLQFSACLFLQQPDNRVVTSVPRNVLIVYLSRTGNTKAIAEIIHKQVGGKLVALELKTPYPANYQATVQQVVR